MKKRFLVLICLLGMALPHLWAAASTEGKEFWIALTIARGPEDAGLGFETFIRVSSKAKKGHVVLENPQTGKKWEYDIPTGTGLLEINSVENPTDPNILSTADWYPFASNVKSQQAASEQTYKTGLKLTCDEEVSVFAAIRYAFGFDASNILPITALQSEYVIQDYPPFANGSPSTSFSNFCILATEDNTEVEITPYSDTYKGHNAQGKPAGKTYTVKLQKGQVYYLVSQQSTGEKTSTDSKSKSLSGSYVKALNNKKIAVFNGDICTRVPNGVSDRDVLYEQAMPIDYWGSEFIVTRSLEKDANRFRITALTNDTEIEVDGYHLTTLDALETCEIELAKAIDLENSDQSPVEIGYQFLGDVLHIETTCPVEIFNYDTGNKYKSEATTDNPSSKGAPSMTWVSPLEQKISNITFSAMHTKTIDTDDGPAHTRMHFTNIVTRTDNVESMELHEISGGALSANMLKSTDFIAIPNTEYSYARIKLNTVETTTGKVFTLSGRDGFVAHVYGNGNTESYSYSAGSSAAKQYVTINSKKHTDLDTITDPFCINDPINFSATIDGQI